MQNGAKFPGIPAGIFLKTYSQEFPEIPEREFPVALGSIRICMTFKHILKEPEAAVMFLE